MDGFPVYGDFNFLLGFWQKGAIYPSVGGKRISVVLVLRCLGGGVLVAEDVPGEIQSLEGEASPASTSFVVHSSAVCRSKYTRKLLEDRPAVRIISESVEPDFRTAVASPHP